MAQQKSLNITEKQGSWKVAERPIPKPGKREVLVKVHATALNPVDWKIQKHALFPVDEYPAVIGSDSSGEVVEVGENVFNFVKGDRVLHQGWYVENDKATFQQYSICPVEILTKIPDSLTFDAAATIPLGLATAVVGFYHPVTDGGIGLTPFWTPDKGKYKGEPIVILGGSSSVGQFAIQVARLSGFSPIITTASLKHEAFIKGLGATHVIDRNATDVVRLIKSILPDGATGVLYDPISDPDTHKLAVQLTKPDAKILITLPKAEGVDFGSRTVSHTFGNVHAQRKIGVALYSVLLSYLEDGRIKPNRVEVLKGGLGAIPGGLERMYENKVSGVKLVVHPWE